MFAEILVVFFLISLDQLSKALVGENITLNPGISFGLGATAGHVVATAVLGIKSIVLIVLCGYRYYAYWRALDTKNLQWWSLIMAGGTSNLLDRLVFGGVRDWLPVPFVGLTNNLADWYIAIAGMIILVHLIRTHDSSTPTNRSL